MRPDDPNPDPATGSALALPARTLGLLGRHWAPLAFWFVVGYLAHDLSLRGSAWLAHRNQWLGFAGLSVGVLIQLTTTIMMLHALRPGLVPFGGRYRSRVLSPTVVPSDQPRLVVQIAETILPFLIFYGAWGLFTDEVRSWGVHVLNQGFGAGIDIVDVFGSVTGVPLAIAAGSWLIRAVCERIYNLRGGRTLGVVVALFEANWMFFGVISVSVLSADAVGWVTGRVAWVESRDAISGLLSTVGHYFPGVEWLTQTWGWLIGHYWPDIKDGLLLPLLWLTIAAVVFGEEMDRDGRVIAGSRLERAGTLFQRLPTRMQAATELFSRGFRDKWTPLVNGLRLVLGAGPVFYLTFCLCYVLIEVGTNWAFIGTTQLLGAHPWDWWFPRLAPIDFVQQGVHEVLKVALLGAAYEACMDRARRSQRQEAESWAVPSDAGRAAGPVSLDRR
ncbi:hypothetical protein [Actinopolymorpha alba]|uniref:hypothetical protein n=1 Tax=Actinopolymorpha alba TaxID=533267 RepID=UPI00037E8AFB|nr:hypothetical protein [Actinopolymorpha alba]